MQILYDIALRLYYLLIIATSFFNKKAKLWLNGRKRFFKKIEKLDLSNSVNIWLHVSSLGEFEQGRPLIEKIKAKNPEYKLILTFFSPSGFEIRKNYENADFVFYLPLDTKKNAKRFIEKINPKIVYFVKYDFWFHFLNQLNKKNIPTFLISAIFREKQIFFRPYGKWFKNILNFFDLIYVQNKTSYDLLKNHNFKNIIFSSDTRIDRVINIAKTSKSFVEIEKFINNKLTIIFGSTWYDDEKIISNFINNYKGDIKYIFAPHEIHQEHINQLIKLIEKNYLLYSDLSEVSYSQANILIINNIGMLSSLYKYADIAYIGGGFGSGIHNTLEPATFGLPIVFGTKYFKFQEAVDMISLEAAFSVSSQADFDKILTKLIEDEKFRKKCGKKSKEYIFQNQGATEQIYKDFFKKID